MPDRSHLKDPGPAGPAGPALLLARPTRPLVQARAGCASFPAGAEDRRPCAVQTQGPRLTLSTASTPGQGRGCSKSAAGLCRPTSSHVRRQQRRRLSAAPPPTPPMRCWRLWKREEEQAPHVGSIAAPHVQRRSRAPSSSRHFHHCSTFASCGCKALRCTSSARFQARPVCSTWARWRRPPASPDAGCSLSEPMLMLGNWAKCPHTRSIYAKIGTTEMTDPTFS